VVASDKLIYWLFQQHAERLQPLVAALLPRMDGYLFSAPVLKEREYRLDGLFLPPADQPDLPVLILEAQMAADSPLAGGGDLPVAGSEFRRPHAGAGVCARKAGVDPTGARTLTPNGATPSEGPWHAGAAVRAAARLLEGDSRRSRRHQPRCRDRRCVRRYSRTVPEICAMGGITVDFTSSVAYRQIFGLGRREVRREGCQEGREEGLQEGRQVRLLEGQQEGR